MHYPIVIHKEQNSDYGVIVPDLPGCFSAGESLEQALLNTKEAIECHLEGILLDNEAIPLPSEYNQHIDNSEYDDGIWALVEIDISKLSGKAKRINITLPERILNIIDLYTKNHAIKNRSALIADATLQYISHEQRLQ